MNKDSWIALIIASVITILVAMPLYYSRGPIGLGDGHSEGSGSKVTEPMKRTEGKTDSTIPAINGAE